MRHGVEVNVDWVVSDKEEPLDPLLTWYLPALKQVVVSSECAHYALVVDREWGIPEHTRQDYEACFERKIREREGPKGSELDILFIEC